GCLGERHVRPDRSIVDQNVDPAKLGQCPGGQRRDLGSFADVGEYSDRFDPKIPGLTRDGLSLLPIGARVDHDMRAFAGELQHGRSADIAPRSGDQRDLPFELAHVPTTPAMLASDAASFDPAPGCQPGCLPNMIQPPLLGVVNAASAVSARTPTCRAPAVPRS